MKGASSLAELLDDNRTPAGYVRVKARFKPCLECGKPMRVKGNRRYHRICGDIVRDRRNGKLDEP